VGFLDILGHHSGVTVISQHPLPKILKIHHCFKCGIASLKSWGKILVKDDGLGLAPA